MTESSGRAIPLLGIWRIGRTDTWDRDELDVLGKARIIFLDEGLGSLQVGAMEGEIDYRAREAARGWRADFSWSGFDEGARSSGWGRVRLVDRDRMRGTLFVHLGDACRFSARRVPKPEAVPEKTGADEPTAPRDAGQPPSSARGDAVAAMLDDILEALEYPEDWDVFLDRRTGRIVTVTENERPYLDGEDLDLEVEALPDWLRSSVEDVRSVLETGDLVRLPDRFDVPDGYCGEACERIAREWAERECIQLVE
ncbi:MAG: hypothetical protein PVI57_21640 [Gemmatimonadota bacterium]|jgi:hypothetical protein